MHASAAAREQQSWWRRFRQRSRLIAAVPTLALALGACGGAPAADAPQPTLRLTEWEFIAPEHVALWYHGLAVLEVGADDPTVLPLYRPGYAAEIARERSAASELTTNAVALRSALESSGAANGAQFLPLYVQDWASLRSGVQAWAAANGDPNRASSQQAASAIAFLSQLFPTAAQRNAIASLVAALESERARFFSAYWAAQQQRLPIQELRARWLEIQPRLENFLLWNDAAAERAIAVGALGPEGRSEMSGQPARIAIGLQAGEDAELAIVRLLHELVYPLAAQAVSDAVAPAEIREVGEAVLVGRAAARAGAMLGEELSPQLEARYREYYAEAGGGSAPAFERTFPLPDGLEEALEDALDRQQAGI